MQRADIPDKFPIPFAGPVTAPFIRPIPESSQIGIDDGAASLETGFPPLCFSPLASGGVPPQGRDFNGIFKQITQWSQWQAACGPVQFDAVFSAAIGGYPEGAIVESVIQAGLFYRSTADDNTSDPDASGPNWTAFVPTASTGVAGQARNLSGSNSSGTVAAWTADEMVVETVLGGLAKKLSSISVSINLATTGANGMDTGAIPAAGDLHVYLIHNPLAGTTATLATVAGSGQTIYPGGNMPAGYTMSALLWSGRTTGSALRNFCQRDRDIQITTVEVLTGGTSLTPAAVDFSTAVPINAKSWSGYSDITATSGLGNFVTIQASSVGTGVFGIGRIQISGQTTQNGSGPVGTVFTPIPKMLFATARSAWYYFTLLNGGNLDITCNGYSI